MSKLVKQDINFLEYPLWIQDEELANKAEYGYVWKDREGYVYRAGYKPPVKIDFVFLLYLLLQSQQEGWKDEIVSTKYRIIKSCGIVPSKPKYDRLEDSLKRWTMVGIEFKGTFYDGKEYQIMNFGIIDEWKIERKTRLLKIRFSPSWLLKIRESNYFKYINFEQVKSLRSPLVIRLYEILVKSFQGRNIWEINVMKLAQKIPMNEKYPADVIPKIKAAINRINEYSSLKIKLTIKRPKRGKAVFTFRKVQEDIVKNLAPTAGLPENDSFKELITLLPQRHQGKKTILDAIASAYHKHGFEYVARNIRYSNQCCNGNYRAYLAMALKEDWGIAIQEDEEAEKRAMKERECKAIEKANYQQEERELTKRVKEYIEKLPPDELEILKEQALERLEPLTQEKVKAGDYYAEAALKIEMESLVSESLK